jgi:GntR family transcriptional regulator/MocR family aminotransferase
MVQAISQLTAEGYVTARQGSGTRVAAVLPEELLTAAPSPAAGERTATVNPLSQRGLARAVIPQGPPTGRGGGELRLLRPGTPALDRFPRKLWSRLVIRRSRGLAVRHLDYGDGAGYEPLREAIAVHVSASRGVQCHPGQVIVTAGAQQALEVAAHMLLDPGDPVWMEEPGYLGARSALLSASARIVSVPVDGEGMRIEGRIPTEAPPRLVYVTPSHQYPLGGTLSLTRRLRLLRWASESGAWILEDDYDTEFRYVGRPLTALTGLDESGRVLYVGTFSKTLFPALRLGFLIVPEALVEPFMQARRSADQHPPALEQMVLADFIREGHFARHVRRMRRVYEARQVALLEAIRDELPGELDARPVSAGLHLVAFLPEGVDDRAVARKAAELGAEAMPLSRYYLGGASRPGLVLGFATVPEERARDAARLLGRAIRSVVAPALQVITGPPEPH